MSNNFTVDDFAVGPGEFYKGRFEYRIESRPRNPANPPTREDLTRWLDSFGASGWQLCSVFEDNYGTSEFYFKRELP